MTTRSWSDVIVTNTDAGFRAWGSDYSAHLAAVGMVQSADTGQINWTTVLKPTVVNTVAGYEIWKFNDSLQATAPIYVKIEYGMGGATTTQIGIWITVGTGSDGAGTITGFSTSRRALQGTVAIGNQAVANSAVLFPNYFCHTAGFLGCVFRSGSANNNFGSFSIERYGSNIGAPNGDGFFLHYANSTTSTMSGGGGVSVRTASPNAGPMTAYVGGFILSPGVQTSSLDENGDLNVYGHWYPGIKMRPSFAMCSYFPAEIGTGTTFSVALVGTTPRTFLAVGNWIIGASDAMRGAMLWE